MHWLRQDLVYGFRGIRKQPSFAILAILALALGIGAATTIFSVIQNVLLDPFPYAHAERVVSFYIHDVNDSRPNNGRSAFKPAEFLDYQEQNHVFSEMIGGGNEDIRLTTREATELFDGAYVTPNTFSFLGVPAMLGRTLMPDDVKPGAPPVFVMGYKLWNKRFGLDPTILGRSFVLNNILTTLVGIMPPRFTKRGADIYRAQAVSASDPQASQLYFLLQARLKPGVTLQQAQADIQVIAQRLAKLYPDNYPKQLTVQMQTWLDQLVGQFRKTLYTLAAAVGLLLLIACSNVANMLLARATAREKEMAIRSALGAGRWRLIRQLLVESMLLALGGALVGCLFAYGGIKALVAVIPEESIPHEAVIRMNVPVLLFSLGAAVFTALLFGLVPALQTVKRDVVEPLKDAGKGVSGGFRRGKLRSTLVVIEVALSIVLLAGAGLLMRTFAALQDVELGLNPHNIFFARVPFPRGQYKTAASKQQFFNPLLERVRSLPGVIAATTGTALPPFGGIRSDLEIAGKTHTEKWDSIYQLCSEGYFPTLGLRLLRGRVLSETEVNDARKVAVVNQTLVKRYFGDEDPLGREVKLTMLATLRDAPVKDPVFTIIGVVADARNQGIQEPPTPEVFIPYTITGAFDRTLMVRTTNDPLILLNTLRREIWAVDHNIALTMTGRLDDYLKTISYAEPRFTVLLLGVFAGVGLALVAIGVYSVIAYTVSRQTHEIGIRMALGAGAGDVFGMVLRVGSLLIGLGIAAGLIASLAATRLIASLLWGVSPRDPITLGAAIAVVVIVGLAACYFPARRATRVDPMTALRYG